MKTLFTIMVILAGVGIGGFFPTAAQLSSPLVPGGTDGLSAPAEPAQKEGSADHALGLRQQRARPDAAVQFESEAPRKALPEQRRDEALRFHHNLLDRFQNADSTGQFLLSFSERGRVDLTLRSVTGAEAPLATLKPREETEGR